MPSAIPKEDLSNVMLESCRASVSDTFEQMVFMPVTPLDAVQKQEGAPRGCISGTIGLTGFHSDGETELRAKLSLIFPENLAQTIFRSMMMMGPDDPVEMAELRDVVGELTNMTAGGVKTRLSESGFKLSISLPTVAVGQDHYLGDPSGILFSQVVPVQLDGGLFFLEVSAT